MFHKLITATLWALVPNILGFWSVYSTSNFWQDLNWNLFSSNLEYSPGCLFFFLDPSVILVLFEGNSSVVLSDVPYSEFVQCFLMLRLRLNSFGKNIEDVIMYFLWHCLRSPACQFVLILILLRLMAWWK